jgi:brefeldin A-inhibited guanine nucleotide-exchange protein 3
MLSLGRRILITCWDGILDVLSVLISGRSACGITGSLTLMFNAKEENRKARQAICTSLEGLQTATRLSSVLGKYYHSIISSDHQTACHLTSG